MWYLASVNNGRWKGFFKQLSLYGLLKGHFMNSVLMHWDPRSTKSNSVTWKCKQRLCEEALLTAEAPAHAKPLRHVLVRRLVHAIILFYRLFHVASLSLLSSLFRRSPAAHAAACWLASEREKKKEGGNKTKRVHAHVRPGRSCRVLFF